MELPIEIQVAFAGAYIIALSFLGIAGITGLILGRYFKKCVGLGMQEYEGRHIRGVDPSQYERWQRIYMFHKQRRGTLAIIQQLPFYLATIFLLIIMTINMAIVTGGTFPWWILFPFYIVVHTLATCIRASNKSAEFEKKD